MYDYYLITKFNHRVYLIPYSSVSRRCHGLGICNAIHAFNAITTTGNLLTISGNRILFHRAIIFIPPTFAVLA